jgi:hypothetical protein
MSQLALPDPALDRPLRLLQALGFGVLGAESGSEALRQLAGNPAIDLIVADFRHAGNEWHRSRQNGERIAPLSAIHIDDWEGRDGPIERNFRDAASAEAVDRRRTSGGNREGVELKIDLLGTDPSPPNQVMLPGMKQRIVVPM